MTRNRIFRFSDKFIEFKNVENSSATEFVEKKLTLHTLAYFGD